MAQLKNEEQLVDLHYLLTEMLTASVQEGENLNIARQFLKDNGIDVSAQSSGGSNIHQLASALPFQDEEETIAQ